MQTILSKIIRDKKKEVQLRSELFSISLLEKSPFFDLTKNSLAERLATSSAGIIAEHKRRSPSKSIINVQHSTSEIVRGYEKAGAQGISVLTDRKYFGGSLEDLNEARLSCSLPLLRKDFFISEYQIIEAKAHGANVILLIASVLTPAEIEKFAKLAHSLELETLLEVHNEKEIPQDVFSHIDMMGVNNRNLSTFEVSIETSKRLASLIPDKCIKISESGISDTRNIKSLQEYGYRGFLIGETFMKTENPSKTASQFITEING